jgi:hypothetical protein
MADIDIVRKRTSLWPWIVGLIVLALLAWVLLGLFGAPGTTTEGVAIPVFEPLASGVLDATLRT